ncbi:MAG: WYL domain-containing protein, partial [Clostridia bacterium]|nr:WYL domain-containing protein [Clostridia bacterium]
MLESKKVKLLLINQMLKEETDPEHPLPAETIIKKLKEYNVSSDLKDLLESIKLLNEYGFDVKTIDGDSIAYYVEDSSFETSELKILIDAVQAAGFITESKTHTLVNKISALGGKHRAELIKRRVAVSRGLKHTNDVVFDAVDVIEDAISSNKQCSFLYFDYDGEGNRVYRKDKARYVVNPLTLVFSEDNYYLIGYNDKYGNVSTYRVDKMAQVAKEETDISKNNALLNFDINDYRKQAFSMFHGDTTEVSLLCEEQAIDA